MKNKGKDKIDKNNSESNWDRAIAEAERQIAEAGIHLAELKSALRVFKRRRDEGVAWPGTTKP
jgi:hypothetical protein